MSATAADLRDALASAPESDYVRIVATWLRSGAVTDSYRPAGVPVIDALVASAVAHLARQQGIAPPPFAAADNTALESFWVPGGDRFFAYSLAHAPAEFAIRGLVVEADSLVSV